MYIIAALSSLALVAAQSSNFVIQVGSVVGTPNGGATQFIPPSVAAKNGDTITFRFTGAPGNHSVTQSSFTDPCNPVPGGFDSGNVFIPSTNVSETPEWVLTVTDTTKPIWFFCKQFNPVVHCAQGMVGAINAPASGNTFDAFQSAAKLSSGTPNQSQGGLVGLGASASALPAPITGGASLFAGSPPASATAGSSAAPVPSSPGYPPSGGAGSPPSGSSSISPSGSPPGSSNGSPSNSPTSSGSPANPTGSGSSNSTNAAPVISVNTFLVFSAAAMGFALT